MPYADVEQRRAHDRGRVRDRTTPEDKRKSIDNRPFREAFERSGMSTNELARRLGWFKRRSDRPHMPLVPDGTRAMRAIGRALDTDSRGYGPRYRQRVTYGMALRLARALDLDPWEVGL